MDDDRPPLGEPQDDMAVTDRQWTYQVMARWSPREVKELVRDSKLARARKQVDDAEASE